jgi:hypothetical protein
MTMSNFNEEDYLRQHLNQLENKNKIVKETVVEHRQQKDNSRSVDLQYQTMDVKHFPCGMFYPTGTVIQIRPALVKEVQAYSMVDDNNFPDIIDKMDDMLMSCVRIKYQDGNTGTYLDIKEQDRIYILFVIRELTFQQGMYLTVNKTCECKTEVQIELKRTNFSYFKPDTKLMKFFDNYTKNFVFEYKGNIFNLTMPNIGLQKSFTKYITDEVSQKREPNLSFLKIMPFLLGDRNSIEVKEIKDELNRFQELSLDAFQFLNSAVGYMKFGIEKLIKTCDSCGKEVHTDMVFPNGASGIFVNDDSFASFIEQ